MRNIFIAIVVLLIQFQSSCATIFLPIDFSRVHRVELSSRFQNRIAVDQGRIVQVVHPGCDIDINLNPEVGQVFIYPLTNYPGEISLSIITDDGRIQDFELIFVDKSAEIVILEEDNSCCEEPFLEEPPVIPGNPDYVVHVVKSLLCGKIPDCFVACDIYPEVTEVKRGLKAVLVSKFVNCHESVYVWRIESTTRRNLKILEKDVNFQRGSWIYLDKNYLVGRGHTLAIVGVKN